MTVPHAATSAGSGCAVAASAGTATGANTFPLQAATHTFRGPAAEAV